MLSNLKIVFQIWIFVKWPTDCDGGEKVPTLSHPLLRHRPSHNCGSQQQWLGSCIARLPVHHCPSAATIAAAVGGAQVLSSIIFFTMLLLCCTGHAEGLRQQRSCADGSAPDPEQLCSVSVVTGAGVGRGRLQADAQCEDDRTTPLD